MKIEGQRLTIELNETDLSLVVNGPAGTWRMLTGAHTWVEFRDGSRSARDFLSEADAIEILPIASGTGKGVRVRFSGFPSDKDFAMDTIWWIEEETGLLYAHMSPVREASGQLVRVVWPAPFDFESRDSKDVTVYPLMQGTLIPNGWPQEFDLDQHWELESEFVYTRSAYMPWWGQLRDCAGYMAIADTPWDAGFLLRHPAHGATSVQVQWHASLGCLSYARSLRFEFLTDCNYVTLCKHYRAWLRENGRLTTLQEKIRRNPRVETLMGTAVVHTGIWQEVKQDCRFYGVENPESVFVPYFCSFEQRAAQLEQLSAKGLRNAYLHVDGWGNAGYDSQHPDVLPPAEKAGGWEGLELLEKKTRELGFLFALHDQYRDFYLDAPSYDPELAVHDCNQNVPTTDLWVGGRQAFLCPSQSLQFIRRNYIRLKEKGLQPDGVYLDVFSCVVLDECWHPAHPVTRRQCMEYRENCFQWMCSQGIIVSSEEGIGWAMNSLDLVHHANYALVHEKKDGTLCGECTFAPYGIPVPLLNLVYHDCVVTPWYISEADDESPIGQSGFLHAMLNGGVPYVAIDASEEEIRRAGAVSDFHRLAGGLEMVSHRFVDGFHRQQSEFAGGICVEVDFETGEYRIFRNGEKA